MRYQSRPRYRSRSRSFTLVTALILAVSACGSDDDGAGVRNLNEDDGSVRSLAGFATAEDRLHRLDGYYGSATPLDDWMSEAIAGTGRFEGASHSVRRQATEKGAQNQIMVAWVVHELNTAANKAAECDIDADSGAPHNWAEGWASYHGASPQCAPYATADSQAAIRYASLEPDDVEGGDLDAAAEHRAEGLAFWRIIEAIVAEAGADVDAVNAVYDLSAEPGTTGGGDEVRVALQPAFDNLGISADDIGTLG